MSDYGPGFMSNNQRLDRKLAVFVGVPIAAVLAGGTVAASIINDIDGANDIIDKSAKQHAQTLSEKAKKPVTIGPDSLQCNIVVGDDQLLVRGYQDAAGNVTNFAYLRDEGRDGSIADLTGDVRWIDGAMAAFIATNWDAGASKLGFPGKAKELPNGGVLQFFRNGTLTEKSDGSVVMTVVDPKKFPQACDQPLDW